jgi:hypothetical protein
MYALYGDDILCTPYVSTDILCTPYVSTDISSTPCMVMIFGGKLSKCCVTYWDKSFLAGNI